MAFFTSEATEELTKDKLAPTYKVGDVITVKDIHSPSGEFILASGTIVTVDWNSLCEEFFYDIYIGHCIVTKKQAYVCSTDKWVENV